MASIGRARKMANLLHSPLALVDKRNLEENAAETINVIGNVKGKNAIIIDDLIDTGATITLAAKGFGRKRGKIDLCLLYSSSFHGEGYRQN